MYGGLPTRRLSRLLVPPHFFKLGWSEVDIPEDSFQSPDLQKAIPVNRDGGSKVFARKDVMTAANSKQREALTLEKPNHLPAGWTW